MKKLSNYFNPLPNAPPSAPSAPLKGMMNEGETSDPPLRFGSNTPHRNDAGGRNRLPTGKQKVPAATQRRSNPDASASPRNSTAAKTVIPDSEGEETDDSLEDLSDLLKPKSAAKSVKPTKTEMKARKQIRTISPVVPKLEADIPTYTFSLDALISQKVKDTEREETIQRTEALIANADNADHVITSHPQADKSLLDAAVGNEAGGKVLDMLNRREAWRVEYTWYFFDRTKGSTPWNPFPTSSLRGWALGMKGISTQTLGLGLPADVECQRHPCAIRCSCLDMSKTWLSYVLHSLTRLFCGC